MPLRQRLFVLTCSLLLGTTLLGAVASSVRTSPLKGRRSAKPKASLVSVTRQDQSPHASSTNEQATSDHTHTQTANNLSATATATALPKLIENTFEHDFGLQDPLAHGHHTFTIHNDGPGDLYLVDHRSSCTCTIAQFPRAAIRSGDSADIVLRWHTPATSQRFEQTAEIVTNDPHSPSIRFMIRGQVRMHLGATPQEFAFPSVRPGQPATTSVTFSSQVWPDFRIRNVTSSLDTITWNVLDEPAAEGTAGVEVVRAQQLAITLPPDLPEGPFQHWVRVDVDPHQDSLPLKTYEFPLRGRVLKRLAVYGPGVDHRGTLDLGVVPYDQGVKQRWTLKVYDETPQLDVKHVEVTPDFVQARLVPYNEAGERGIYFLELEIPPKSPEGIHVDRAAGSVHLEFNHPRIDHLDLRVEFSIARPLTP